MMCAVFFRSNQDTGWLVKAIDRNFEWFRERYRRALHALLDTWPVMIVMALLLLLVLVACFKFTKSELAPEEDQGIVLAKINGPPNATAQQMQTYADQVFQISSREPEYQQMFQITGVPTVNQGIGGNQVAGPPDYSPDKSFAGGPSAISRLDRDVISLPGVAAVIWVEGINDFGAADAAVETVEDGYSKGVARLREHIPGVTIVAATLTSALHSIIVTHGRAEVDAKRKALNEFLRTSKIFDGVIDFDAVTIDAATGEIKPVMQPNSSTGGPGDKLHPNRAGYAAMGNAIALEMITTHK